MISPDISHPQKLKRYIIIGRRLPPCLTRWLFANKLKILHYSPDPAVRFIVLFPCLKLEPSDNKDRFSLAEMLADNLSTFAETLALNEQLFFTHRPISLSELPINSQAKLHNGNLARRIAQSRVPCHIAHKDHLVKIRHRKIPSTRYMQNNREQKTQKKPADVLEKPGPVTPTDVPVTSHFVHFHHTNIPRILNKRLMAGDSLKLVSNGDHPFEIFIVGHTQFS